MYAPYLHDETIIPPWLPLSSLSAAPCFLEGLISVGTDADGNGSTEYLRAGALLQITPGTLPAAGATFAVTTAGSGNYSAFFAADDPSYAAVNLGSGNSQVVHLMYHSTCTGADGVIENKTEASCTEDGGYDTVVYCAECGKELSREHTTIPATGHSYGSWYTEMPATCTKNGTERRDCTNCDACETKDIAATGHSWDAGGVTREPTEDAVGEKVYTCIACRETRTETIPELSHTHHYTAAVTPPTCTGQGYTTHSCACGDSYTDSFVAATGHQYSAEHICTNCGQQDPAVQVPTEPETTEPEVTEPTEPTPTEPASTEPTEPEVTEPAHPTKPEATEPSGPATTPPADSSPEPDNTAGGNLLWIVIALGILCLLLILLIILLLMKKRRGEQ